ncbi:hypothetical protein IW150_000388 [Coemansia sp. RSA 2607]|nr:hypothetical protein IW150_000388 [Coemansia sp. RSA 2607]
MPNRQQQQGQQINLALQHSQVAVKPHQRQQQQHNPVHQLEKQPENQQKQSPTFVADLGHLDQELDQIVKSLLVKTQTRDGMDTSLRENIILQKEQEMKERLRQQQLAEKTAEQDRKLGNNSTSPELGSIDISTSTTTDSDPVTDMMISSETETEGVAKSSVSTDTVLELDNQKPKEHTDTTVNASLFPVTPTENVQSSGKAGEAAASAAQPASVAVQPIPATSMMPVSLIKPQNIQKPTHSQEPAAAPKTPVQPPPKNVTQISPIKMPPATATVVKATLVLPSGSLLKNSQIPQVISASKPAPKPVPKVKSKSSANPSSDSIRQSNTVVKKPVVASSSSKATIPAAGIVAKTEMAPSTNVPTKIASQLVTSGTGTRQLPGISLKPTTNGAEDESSSSVAKHLRLALSQVKFRPGQHQVSTKLTVARLQEQGSLGMDQEGIREMVEVLSAMITGAAHAASSRFSFSFPLSVSLPRTDIRSYKQPENHIDYSQTQSRADTWLQGDEKYACVQIKGTTKHTRDEDDFENRKRFRQASPECSADRIMFLGNGSDAQDDDEDDDDDDNLISRIPSKNVVTLDIVGASGSQRKHSGSSWRPGDIVSRLGSVSIEGSSARLSRRDSEFDHSASDYRYSVMQISASSGAESRIGGDLEPFCDSSGNPITEAIIDRLMGPFFHISLISLAPVYQILYRRPILSSGVSLRRLFDVVTDMNGFKSYEAKGLIRNNSDLSEFVARCSHRFNAMATQMSSRLLGGNVVLGPLLYFYLIRLSCSPLKNLTAFMIDMMLRSVTGKRMRDMIIAKPDQTGIERAEDIWEAAKDWIIYLCDDIARNKSANDLLKRADLCHFRYIKECRRDRSSSGNTEDPDCKIARRLMDENERDSRYLLGVRSDDLRLLYPYLPHMMKGLVSDSTLRYLEIVSQSFIDNAE